MIAKGDYDLVMKKELPPSRTADQFVVRFPDGMRDRIAEEAKTAGRSMNAEIVQRLADSLESKASSGPDLAPTVAALTRDLAVKEMEMLANDLDGAVLSQMFLKLIETDLIQPALVEALAGMPLPQFKAFCDSVKDRAAPDEDEVDRRAKAALDALQRAAALGRGSLVAGRCVGSPVQEPESSAALSQMIGRARRDHANSTPSARKKVSHK